MHPIRFSKTSKTVLGSGLAVIFVVTAACSLSPPKHMMDVQQGETFTLKQPVSIAAEHLRVYFQHGQVSGNGFDHFEPHCRLEKRTLTPSAETIQPDSFAITAVRIGEEEVAKQQRPPANFMLANRFVGMAVADDNDSDSSIAPTMDYVHFYLKSMQQPDVLRLTCAGSLSDGDPFDEPRSHRPERDKINQILGKIGQIRH